MGTSSKSGRSSGEGHPSGARCRCLGGLVQCRVAHRYPPGGSFPIEFCVTCVMLARWNGPSGSFWPISLHHTRNAPFWSLREDLVVHFGPYLCITHISLHFGAFERTQGHSSTSGRDFGDKSSERCPVPLSGWPCPVSRCSQVSTGGSFPIEYCVTCVMHACWNGPTARSLI